jgi:hypothetical protein
MQKYFAPSAFHAPRYAYGSGPLDKPFWPAPLGEMLCGSVDMLVPGLPTGQLDVSVNSRAQADSMEACDNGSIHPRSNTMIFLVATNARPPGVYEWWCIQNVRIGTTTGHQISIYVVLEL